MSDAELLNLIADECEMWGHDDWAARLRALATASAPAGNEKGRLLEALKPFAEFQRAFNRKPMRGVGDQFYAIHTGTEWAAELTRTDLQRALDAYDAAVPQPEEPRP